MHIYIAAPWDYRDQMDSLAKNFEDAGHTISHKWWSTEAKDNTSPREQAEADIRGVRDSQCVILMNFKMSEGKAVEQGIAIADFIPIIGVSSSGRMLSNNVFHTLDNYTWVDDVKDVLLILKGMEYSELGYFRG